MTFLIGGLSAKQYNSYLNPASDEKKQWNLSHWVAHFHLSRYPTIAVFVNRIAYFLLHRFSEYPNNAYLFQRFKSHDFSKIDSQDQYNVIKEIFTRFQHCSDLDSTALEEVETELKELEELLAKKEGPVDEIIEDIEEEEDSEEAKKEEFELQKKEAEAKEKELKLKKEAEAKEKELKEKQEKEAEAKEKETDPVKQKQIEEAQKRKEAREARKREKAQEAQKRKEELEAKKKKDLEEAQKKKEELETKQKKDLEEAKKKSEKEQLKREGTEKEIVKQPVKIEVRSDKKEDDGISDGKGPTSEEDDIFDPEQDEESNDEKEPVSDKQAKKDPVIVIKDAELNLSKDSPRVKKEDPLPKVEEESLSEQETSDQSKFDQLDEVLVLTPHNKEPSVNEESDTEQSEQTGERLKDVFEKISLSQMDENEEELKLEELEELLTPLSKEVEEVVGQAFPLKDSESIHDLFLGTEESIEAQRLYRKELKILLHFEEDLRMIKSRAEDDRFENYMHEFDGAFQRAWDEAYKQCGDLHKEFAKAFSKHLPHLGKKGEVFCSAEQLQWVSNTIANRFPAIYCLAFDAPSLDIYQSHQMASLARAIFVGVDAHEKGPEIESGSCFYIHETVAQSTPVFKRDLEIDPLLRSGSFIHTYFVDLAGKLSKEASQLKKQLQKLAKTYVKDWLEQPGATLTFGKIAIASGQSSEDFAANDWVAQVRDAYTQALKKMNAEQLQEEIQKAYNCPLVSLVAKTYADEIEKEELTTSAFPEALMRALFNHEMEQAKGNVEIQQGIRRTIEDACFEDPQDITDLAKLAGVSENYVESLIRIRIFYMMFCFGQKGIDPVVRDLKLRAKTMYDPSTCKTVNDPALICESNEERILHFDETFDELTLTVHTRFKDPHKINAVAQGDSVLKVSSISQPREDVETEITELKNLRFSLYSSPEQVRYLIAQVHPQIIMDNMQKLAEELKDLEIYKKANKFKAEKEENDKSNTLYSKVTSFKLWTTQFDSKSYQDFANDGKALDEAIQKAKDLVTYLNARCMLKYTAQVTKKDNIKSEIETIQERFKVVTDMLREVYPLGDEKDEDWNMIRQKSRLLNELVDADPVDVAFSDSDDDDVFPSPRSVSPSPDSSDDENDFGRSVIGKNAGTAQKTFFGHVYDYTIGLAVNETTQVKYLAWKIKRYEDLIHGIQEKIEEYIDSQEDLGDLDTLIKEASKTTAPEWMRQILPILKFCRKELRNDENRMNPDYLEEVRKGYTNHMLQKLRDAADWAKAHPSMPGVEHVNAICYQLYATMDINERCQRIVKTFIKLGQAALGKKSPHLPSERYAMIDGLHEAYEKIHAVPFEAKAAFLNQIGNSAVGWLNGIPGVKPFDPNMQSNPTHVFFNKIIKGKEETYQVKDIAMGSPTIENGWSKVQIAPEFEGMLRYYQKNGLVHLYINNQDFTAASWGGGEANRCQALHDLAEKDFKDTLYVITLSQNTTFYKQRYEINKRLISLKNGIEYVPDMNVKNVKDALIVDLLTGKSKHYLPAHLVGNSDLHQWMAKEIDIIHQNDFSNCDEFEGEEEREKFIQRFHTSLRKYVEKSLESFPPTNGEKFGYSPYYPGANEFKEEMLAQVFDGNPLKTGNCIPADLVKKFDLRKWSEEAIGQIHKELFGGRKDLTVEERRIFIRLFYQNLSRKILLETRADSYNASCKDRIDRGAATDAEDYAYLAILANCMNDPNVIEFFKMLVFARAIIVRKRTIIEERLERLVETVKFMLDHQKELQKLHTALFPDVKITIDQFKLEEDEDEYEEEIKDVEIKDDLYSKTV